MKANDWRKQEVADLQVKLASLGEELFKLKFRNSYRRLENTAKVKDIRRDIARINTVLLEKQRKTV
jgi:large subunit ribosomal protein L29